MAKLSSDSQKPYLWSLGFLERGEGMADACVWGRGGVYEEKQGKWSHQLSSKRGKGCFSTLLILGQKGRGSRAAFIGARGHSVPGSKNRTREVSFEKVQKTSIAFTTTKKSKHLQLQFSVFKEVRNSQFKQPNIPQKRLQVQAWLSPTLVHIVSESHTIPNVYPSSTYHAGIKAFKIKFLEILSFSVTSCQLP